MRSRPEREPDTEGQAQQGDPSVVVSHAADRKDGFQVKCPLRYYWLASGKAADNFGQVSYCGPFFHLASLKLSGRAANKNNVLVSQLLECTRRYRNRSLAERCRKFDAGEHIRLQKQTGIGDITPNPGSSGLRINHVTDVRDATLKGTGRVSIYFDKCILSDMHTGKVLFINLRLHPNMRKIG